MSNIPVNITKHYSYDNCHNCLGYYINFSCYVGCHYISKTYKKKCINDMFDDKKFLYECSLKWCSYLQLFLKIENDLEKECI